MTEALAGTPEQNTIVDMNATLGRFYAAGNVQQFLTAVFLMAASVGLCATSERIVFLGDSLTAGYGLEPEFAYPALVGKALQASGRSVEVVNAGVSGDTTAGGLRRVDWILREPALVLFIALGGNDALRGLPPDETRANLEAIIRRARERSEGIHIILAGMLAPPNMGKPYQDAFAAVYPSLAEEEEVDYMPFLLEGVAGEADLNLSDGIHPNAKGQELIAKNVLKLLQK